VNPDDRAGVRRLARNPPRRPSVHRTHRRRRHPVHAATHRL